MLSSRIGVYMGVRIKRGANRVINAGGRMGVHE
jgi:hypothetical protein